MITKPSQMLVTPKTNNIKGNFENNETRFRFNMSTTKCFQILLISKQNNILKTMKCLKCEGIQMKEFFHQTHKLLAVLHILEKAFQ